MANWTQELFDNVAAGTQLGPRTTEACRRVLVLGEKGTDVAVAMELKSPQISRGISTLRQKLAQLGSEFENTQVFEQAKAIHSIETISSRDLAVQRARELAGESLLIKDPQPGQTYIGRPLVRTPNHVVQVTGRDEAVIHDVSKLERLPNMTFPNMEVKYPSNVLLLASVQETTPGKDRGSRSR